MTKQGISSAKTSRRQVAAIVRLGDKLGLWDTVDHVLDYGGGKWDDTTEALRECGVESRVYDPYNRSNDHNREVLRWAYDHAEAVILSNVLNVIDCEDIRKHVLAIASSIAPVTLITVYEGDKSGVGGKTRDGWQENRRLASYEEEVYTVFSRITRRGPLMIADNCGK